MRILTQITKRRRNTPVLPYELSGQSVYDHTALRHHLAELQGVIEEARRAELSRLGGFSAVGARE